MQMPCFQIEQQKSNHNCISSAFLVDKGKDPLQLTNHHQSLQSINNNDSYTVLFLQPAKLLGILSPYMFYLRILLSWNLKGIMPNTLIQYFFETPRQQLHQWMVMSHFFLSSRSIEILTLMLMHCVIHSSKCMLCKQTMPQLPVLLLSYSSNMVMVLFLLLHMCLKCS